MSVSGKILSHNMQVKGPIIMRSASLGQFLLKSQCSLTPTISPNPGRRKSQTRANKILTIAYMHKTAKKVTTKKAKLNLKATV